ncbi:hypothetical protein ACQPZ2_11475 [Nocardia pseudovaccinii]|uniref:hypothetical protein n=1 Tax=Nocardia pseudovaccinii TaxID=189540 RepID=UPI003D8D3211
MRPEVVADYYPWPGLAFVPIRDAAPSRWALVRRTAAGSPLIRAFAETVSDVVDATQRDNAPGTALGSDSSRKGSGTS